MEKLIEHILQLRDENRKRASQENKETQNETQLSAIDLTVLITIYHAVHHCPKWITTNSIDINKALLKIITWNELNYSIDRLEKDVFIKTVRHKEVASIYITEKGIQLCDREAGFK